jgi:phytoene synthase
MEIDYRIKNVELSSMTGEQAQLASREDYAHCRTIMQRASKNYSTASSYLAANILPHVEALYALMRVGDDRVDVSHQGFASPLEAIENWERLYWSAFETGDSPHPVMRAYLDTALRFGIPAEVMAAYFTAMREDLTIKRFPAFRDLMHYMDGSAIPVGRAMTYILGTRQPYRIEDAIEGADSLSIAMQLSNFWRDIGEDWRISRIYIPQEDMDAFNYSESDVASGRINSNLIDLLEYQFSRTERYYATARSRVKMLASGRLAVMGALEIYRAIMNDIRAHDYDVFTRRAGTTSRQKFALVIKAFVQTLP